MLGVALIDMVSSNLAGRAVALDGGASWLPVFTGFKALAFRTAHRRGSEPFFSPASLLMMP